MAFKKTDTGFREKEKFRDRMEGVFTEELIHFRDEKNETAIAGVDEEAEKLFKASSERNRKRRAAIREELKEAAAEERDGLRGKSKKEEPKKEESAGSTSGEEKDHKEGPEQTEADHKAESSSEEGDKSCGTSDQKTAAENDPDTPGANEGEGDTPSGSREPESGDSMPPAQRKEEIPPRQTEAEDHKIPENEPDNHPEAEGKSLPPAKASDGSGTNPAGGDVKPLSVETYARAAGTAPAAYQSSRFHTESGSPWNRTRTGEAEHTGPFKTGNRFTESDRYLALKKEERKELRDGTAKIAAANVLHAKKDLSNEFSGNYQATGDAFADGRHGLAGSFLDAINPATYIKRYMASVLAAFAPFIASVTAMTAMVFVIAVLLFSILKPIADTTDAVTGFLTVNTVTTKSFTNARLSGDKIDEIIAASGCSETQEKVLRYALSKVGYPYSQNDRSSGWAYDCSSLAYYSWKAAGVDISFGGHYAPTAAEGAKLLKEHNRCVAVSGGTVFSLQPGDLIYYGGKANGRYLGIYHVAIYAGNGMAVEALSTKYGVVYETLRTKNICMVCRPAG